MAKRHKEGPFLPKTGRSTGTTEWALAELLGPAALYAGLFLYLLIWVSPFYIEKHFLITLLGDNLRPITVIN
jgi:hypothetical protein